MGVNRTTAVVVSSGDKSIGRGRLETLALQIGNVFETLTPQICEPTILIFAGDHGIAQSGVRHSYIVIAITRAYHM